MAIVARLQRALDPVGKFIQLGTGRALSILGAETKPKPVGPVTRDDVEVHVKDLLPGGGTIRDKEIDALAMNDAIMHRCYKWYNIDINERQARFWGVPVTSKLRWKECIKDFILNRIRISAFDMTKESCLEQYKKIINFKPELYQRNLHSS